MCFKNLPIEFDAQGKAHLIAGVANPYEYTSISLEERDKKLMEIARKNGQVREIDFDHAAICQVDRAVKSQRTGNPRHRVEIDLAHLAVLARNLHQLLVTFFERD